MRLGVIRTGMAVMAVAVCLPAMGQKAPGKAPAYDVATIKLNKSGDNGTRVWIEGGVFTATNIPLVRLIEAAYGIKADLIFGLPGNLQGANFDVEAKMLEPDAEALKKLRDRDKMLLLAPVLQQRFKLKTHMETRTLPTYDLVTLPAGSKLKQVQGDGDGTIHMNGRELVLEGMSTARLASALGDVLHRKVIDKTGLTGAYNLDLKWTPEGADQAQAGDAPDIFTAVQEQLGLKLQSSKGPSEVLVIDSMELPSEN